MNILLIHQGFPGQFRHLIPKLHDRGHRLVAISRPKQNREFGKYISFYPYLINRQNSQSIHPLCWEFESKVIRGDAVAQKALELKESGYSPKIILGHPGWGEMLFLAEIWPNVPQIHYVEFFHGVAGTDDDFDGGIDHRSRDWVDNARARMKNAHLLSSLNEMQRGITPTHFQHSLLPEWARIRTEVIHDGIDCSLLMPDDSAILKLKSSKCGPAILTFKKGDPVLTFVNRTFEPYRGIHIFLRALAKLQAVHPHVQTILVGNDTAQVSYGEHRNDNQGWLSALKIELGSELDWSRIHQVGTVSHKVLRTIYQVSAVHVYLTYPFVLSWSMLEAMSCGCVVIGSQTKPVEEVIKHKTNGLLVPFKDYRELAETIKSVLDNPKNYDSIRKNAESHIKNNYRLEDCLRKQINLIEAL